MNKQLSFVDVAKGIGIILVVIGHYYPENSPSFYKDLRDFIYTFHMPLFLLMSGGMYIYTKKDIPWVSFIKKKLKRIALPYLIVSLFIIGIKLLTQKGAYVENGVDCMSFLRIFYKPEAGYFLWYLWVLLWMYIICSLSDASIYLNLLMIASVVLKFLPIDFSEIFCLSELKSNAMYFMLGVILFRMKIYENSNVARYRLMFVALWVLLSLLWFGGICKSALLMSIVGSLGVLAISDIIGDKSQKLLYIGASSFVIYLFHTTFMGFAKSFVFKLSNTLFVENVYLFILSSLIVVLFGIILPLLLQEFILKKNRVTKFLFGYK